MSKKTTVQSSKTKKKAPAKKAPAKKTLTKKQTKHKVQKSRIEKLFDDKDFIALTGNSLTFIDAHDKHAGELITVMYDVFSAIKKANPNVNTYQPSIWLLFASIAEVFYLHKDRLTRQRQKKEMYSSWINYRDACILHLMEVIRISEARIKEIKDKKQKLSTRSFEIKIQESKLQILEHEQQIKAHMRSMELKMFDVTSNEKLTFDMTAQVMNKNEKLLALMKEFGINPKLASPNVLSGTVTPNGLFKSIHKLGADE